MSQYITSPFKPSPILSVAGIPEFLFGSYNERVGPTQGIVKFVKTNGTTIATVKIQILSGNIPVSGSLITVVGSANSSNFDVTNVAISNVTKIPDPVTGEDTGLYSLTYTISSTATPLAYTADAAQFIIPQPEVGEALSSDIASVPLALPFIPSLNSQEHVVAAVVTFPSIPTSVTVTLQQAVFDINAEYADIATIAVVAGGSQTTGGGPIMVDPVMGRFLRFKAGTVVGGSSPTIIAKLIA